MDECNKCACFHATKNSWNPCKKNSMDKHGNSCNSLTFWATASRFCMEVGYPYVGIHAKKIMDNNGNGYKSLIFLTTSFWICIEVCYQHCHPCNKKSMYKQRNSFNSNSLIFWATAFRFGMEVGYQRGHPIELFCKDSMVFFVACMEIAITHSFLDLQLPDFALKYATNVGIHATKISMDSI